MEPIYAQSKCGKDSGFGNYAFSSGDSTVDLFNVAQTTVAIDDDDSDVCSNNKNSTTMLGRARESTKSIFNEAGFLENSDSLCWDSSSSDSASETQRDRLRRKLASNGFDASDMSVVKA